MGGRGRGRSRTQRKHFQQNRENVWKRSKSDPQSNDGNNEANTHWEPFATKNEAFDEYYKGQGIVAPEEWNSFNEYLRKPLPAAFRVNSSSQFHMEIRSQLENDFMKSLQSQDEDGMDVVALKPLLWYPDNLAWQSNYSRNQLRKNQNLERFHEFLKLENEIGNITRQEAVSMVPPLFLDVHPDHVVLDMCAAPGSKTFQLLEMIYKLTEPGSLPSGMVIANDLDVQRCNLLIHQTKRMCTANLIVTNHNAQHFPSCHLHRNHSIDSQSGNAGEPAIRQLQFDRILCDVPCSGDGTLRKAPDIWKKWNSGMGNGIHALQVQIASRGIALLKVGGRMVYSTCSMNPVENEAVVAEILRQWSGAIELLDVSEKLPQLARRQGLKSWKVWDKGLWLTSCEDVPKYRRSVITPSMFPSGKAYKETVNSELETEVSQSCGVPDGSSGEDHLPLKNNLDAEVSDLPLDRCMRIVPHDQNSGAFFIAVFQKVSTGRDALHTQKASTHPQMDNVIENLNSEVSESNLQDDHVDAEMNGDPLDSIQSDVEENGKDELEENIKDETEENAKDEPEPSVNVKIDAKLVAGKRKLQIQGRWRGVDPVIFYKDEKVVNSIFEFYGIVESFPLKGHVITRNNDTNHVKRIYYISSSVKEVLELNFLANQQLKIASVGLKMFERQTSREGTSTPCMFRISSEGLPLILPHMIKQILHVQALDFKHLLQYKSIKFPDFVDPELREQVTKLMLGCCVVVLSKDNRVSSHSSQVDAPIAIGCWRGRNSISVMVNATDCQELLERVSLLVSVNESVSSSEVLPDAEAAEAGNPNGSEAK